MPRLQVLNGKRQGAVFDVARGTEHIIGHRQSASITIDDPWVSWDHARVFFNEEDSSCWIEDLGSTNGTYVNCVRVKREPLRHEDIVFLGKTHVIFLMPAEEHQDGVSPIFGSSSEGEMVPLSSASQAGATVLAPGSSADPFAEDSGGQLPLRDPFASAPSQAANRALSRSRDPFSGSGVDPFSAGPDHAAMRGAPPPPPPPGSARFRAHVDPAREARSLSETNADDNALIAGSAELGANLHLSRLDEEEDLSVSGPSAAEISRLITGRSPASSSAPTPGVAPAPFPAGAGAAPLPAGAGAPSRPADGPPDGPNASTRRGPPDARPEQPLKASPMAMANRRAPTAGMPRPTPPKTLSGRIPRPDPAPTQPAAPPPSAPRSDPFGGSRRLSGPHARPPVEPNRQPPAPVADDLAMPQDVGQLAFERARLEDMVRRMRAALDAASQQNPQAVQQATARLRDQELARQARRIAELEQQTASLKADLIAKQDELDAVTDEMIDKEDTIDQLRAEVDRLSSRVAVPPRGRPGPSVQGGASSYGSIPL